jgi:hypothetical protein
MSGPRTERHKCSLFEEEIPAITYNSGGTYTLGALLEVSRGHLHTRGTSRGKQEAPTHLGYF